MTKKQKEKIILLEYFIPTAIKSGEMHTMGDKTADVTESMDGVDPEQAFMDYQSNGIVPTKVSNLHRFNQLKHAQRLMAMMEKMWREDLGKLITTDELKEDDGSFESSTQYEIFCNWIDKTFGGNEFNNFVIIKR